MPRPAPADLSAASSHKACANYAYSKWEITREQQLGVREK